MAPKLEALEIQIGTQRLLIDDYDKLGWEFVDLPGNRVLVLREYSEGKAEGCDACFLVQEGKLINISKHGGGVHGVPWFHDLIKEGGVKFSAPEHVDVLAKFLRKALDNALRSGNFTPIRKGLMKADFRWKVRSDPESNLVYEETPVNGLDGEMSENDRKQWEVNTALKKGLEYLTSMEEVEEDEVSACREGAARNLRKVLQLMGSGHFPSMAVVTKN